SLLRGEECVERRWWMGTVVAQPGCEPTKGSFCFAFPVGCRSCTVQKRNCTSNSRGVTQCMTGNPRERQTKSFPRSVHNPPAEPPPSSPCTIPTSQKRQRKRKRVTDTEMILSAIFDGLISLVILLRRTLLFFVPLLLGVGVLAVTIWSINLRTYE
ncbi:unnamed protein product, partial [Musa acuminata subsp. burmannicoides]